MAVPVGLKDLIDQFAKIIQSIAYGIAAFWIFWNYRQNATHVRRLELTLDASVEQRNGRFYLVAIITVKNPALRIVKFSNENAVLLISRLKNPDEVAIVRSSEWEGPALAYALKWNIDEAPNRSERFLIEPGIQIFHQQLKKDQLHREKKGTEPSDEEKEEDANKGSRPEKRKTSRFWRRFRLNGSVPN